jgi:hypothetical protein
MPLKKPSPAGVRLLVSVSVSVSLVINRTNVTPFFLLLCAPQTRRYLNPTPPTQSVPTPFPADLADPDDSPNVYVTQPTTIAISAHTPFPPSALSNAASLHSLSPTSSPTTADFPATAHVHTHQHSLSRQPSFPHNHTHSHTPYGTSPSPVPMDFEDAQGRKRQRTTCGVPPPLTSGAGANGVSPAIPVAVGADGTKQRLARARSDSAPLGYNNFGSNWTATRPRSGSGLAVRAPRREDIVVPSIGTIARAVAAAQPVLPPMGSLVVTTPGA